MSEDVEWLTEWAIEVTWRDWRKAGAKGPTSRFGPFERRDHLDRFLAIQTKDADVASVRTLTRRAAYTDWVPTTVEEASRVSGDPEWGVAW